MKAPSRTAAVEPSITITKAALLYVAARPLGFRNGSTLRVLVASGVINLSEETPLESLAFVLNDCVGHGLVEITNDVCKLGIVI